MKNPAGGQSANRVRLFNANAGNGSAKDAFFNSLSVCYPPTLVINEVDYDQPGADNLEFVELKNVSAGAVNLDNYTLEFVDGADGLPYATADLPNVSLAAGDYYVLCKTGSSVPNCDFNFSNAIQDGAPDALRLRLGTSLNVDALSYEGSVTGAVEGSGTGLNDAAGAGAQNLGLSRIPDGSDNNTNNTDFVLTCISPGNANTSATDSDGDGIPNSCDNCPSTANTEQADADNDGVGDACDPEMDVRGNNVSIANGDMSPSGADFTDFGQTLTGGGMLSRTFTVHNTAAGSLSLSGSPQVQLSGTQAADFSVTTQTTSPVSGGSSTSFTVQFAPTVVGIRTASVVIANNDNDENPYTFAIRGEGLPQPQSITVSGNNLPITNRTNTVSAADGTDFGNVPTGGTGTATFSIRNGVNSLPLSLTGVPKVTIADRDAADFSVTVQPSSPLGSGGETSFTISFTPSAQGLRTAIIVITHNDQPDNPFVFTIQGFGTGL